MSALPSNPDPSPNQKMDPVSRFLHAYAKALVYVRVSRDHAATEGWQALYADHIKHVRDDRRRLAETLAKLANTLERTGLDEDGEKAIGDIKKEAIELREAEQHWQRQMVDPVSNPAMVCQQMRSDAMAEARAVEAREPLIHVGLSAIMQEAIDSQPRATWDAETGRVGLVGKTVNTETGEETTGPVE